MVKRLHLPVIVPSSVPGLAAEEQNLVSGLSRRLSRFRRANARQDSYYEARQLVRDLGIAIPPHLRDLEAAVGWPAMGVDVLGERLSHDGWQIPGHGPDDDLGISEIVAANKLRREFTAGHTKAMRYGIAFGVAGRGGPGEPNPLVHIESPQWMTATWDRRRRVVREALLIHADDEQKVTGATVWYRDQMLVLARDGRAWRVVDRHRNPIGRPPVVRLVNRYSVGDGEGQSEITRVVRTLTDNAVRTLVSLEVNRDFHAAPKFWLLGADASQFVDKDGNEVSAWETYIGRLNAIPAPVDEDGNVAGDPPTIQQSQGSSPAPYLDILRGLAQMQSAEQAMPVSYYGLVHDSNPASADAALIDEARLNLRTEQRQTDFGEDEGELMRLAIWIRDGVDPGVTPLPIWVPAATPTMAAASDSTQKLVASDVLPAQAPVTLRRVGLSEQDRREVEDYRRRERAGRTAAMLSAVGDTSDDSEDFAQVKAQADAMGVLIRAGVDPDDAAARVGLSGVQFSGAVPTSLRMPQSDAQRLED